MEILELLEAKGYVYVRKGENEYAIECVNAANHQGGYDSKPSLSINIDKMVAHCHACGFSMNEDRLTRWLMGGELDDLSLETMALRAKIRRIELAAQPELSEARQVFIPPGEPWEEDGYRGISIDTYRKLGAIRCSRGFYENRLVFPIYLGGELIGVDARALSEEMQPKYLRNKNSSCKTDWLFPYDVVSAMNPTYVILGEGMFHAVNAIDKGFPALVFFGSNNFSTTKLRMVMQLGVEEVYYCKDNDAAGEKAEQEICSMLKDWLPTYTLDTSQFGEGKDLGDVSREQIQWAIDNKRRFK